MNFGAGGLQDVGDVLGADRAVMVGVVVVAIDVAGIACAETQFMVANRIVVQAKDQRNSRCIFSMLRARSSNVQTRDRCGEKRTVKET